MSKKSPNVVFKSKYCLALNSRDNKNQSLNYKEDRLKDVDDMVDYFSNEKKKTVGMFEYYMGHTRKENYNLMLLKKILIELKLIIKNILRILTYGKVY